MTLAQHARTALEAAAARHHREGAGSLLHQQAQAVAMDARAVHEPVPGWVPAGMTAG